MRARSCAATLLVALVLVACTASARATDDMCFNELDDMFLNRCFAQSPGILTVIANYVAQFINPRALTITTISAVLVLPILFIANTTPRQAKSDMELVVAQFRRVRFKLLHFLHRLGFSLVLDIALYAAFRQSRPCRCMVGGQLQHIGSKYGMPSGDAWAGALFAAYVFEEAPYSKVGARVFSVVALALACMARVVLGFHSIAQVTVGTCFGILTHIYTTRAPQYMVFVDTLVQIILGAVLLQVDPNLSYGTNDQNNLFSWYMWGMSIQLFTCLMLFKHHWSRRGSFKSSLVRHKPEFEFEEVGESTGLLDATMTRSVIDASDVIENKRMFRTVTDSTYMMLSFLAMSALNIISFCVQTYNWFPPKS